MCAASRRATLAGPRRWEANDADRRGPVAPAARRPDGQARHVVPEVALGGACSPSWRWPGPSSCPRRRRSGAPPRCAGGPPVPEDPVLAGALATVVEKERSAQALVTKLGKGVTPTLGGRLAERGLLQRRDDKVLGLFPRTRWPARDTSHEGHVRRALTVVLVDGGNAGRPDRRLSSRCCTPSTAPTRPCPTTASDRVRCASGPSRSPRGSGPPRRSRTRSPPRPPRAPQGG